MLISLTEILVIKSLETGLIIKQDIAGQELFLQFEKGKDWFDYAWKVYIGEDLLVHPTDGIYYDVEFEISSNYWRKGNKYFTNATLISIELS